VSDILCVDMNHRDIEKEIDMIKKQNEIYREALEKYADFKYHEENVVVSGKIARQALKQVEELKHRE
jgi:hypothetical protein